MSVTEDQDVPRETFMEVHMMRSSSSGVTPPSRSVDEKDEIAVPAALRNVRRTEWMNIIKIIPSAP